MEMRQRYKRGKLATYIDPDTGELIELTPSYIQNYVANDGESFYQLYAGFIGLLQDGVEKSEMKIFGYLLEHYMHNNVFNIGKAVKQDMEDRLGVKLRTIEGCLVSLRKPRGDGTALLLYNTSNKSYCINPRYVIQSFDGKDARLQKIKICLSNGFEPINFLKKKQNAKDVPDDSERKQQG
jgi:hypothetical protein